jgi:hypothetical protein
VSDKKILEDARFLSIEIIPKSLSKHR